MDVESLAKQLILQNMTPEQQNAVLESVRASLLEARSNQKRRVSENVGMVVDALKKIEADIRAKYDDLGQKITDRVNSVRDGVDGIDGRDGKDGKDGRPGRDGATGPMGPAGKDGVNGVDGEDGVSVTDAKIDFDGSLVITLSNGREINVGEVVAPDLAERIKVITNGGGTSQAVLDALASLQAQIDALVALDYRGTWNASTNTPTLASGVGDGGDYYIVSVAGSTNLDGITDWQPGDWLIFNGTVWQKIDQSWATAGANNNITSMTGITGGISSPDFIQFDTSATVTNAAGRLYWDATQQTMSVGLNANIAADIGQTLYAYATNAESVTITKGQPVYMFAAQGDRVSVKLAYNTGDATSAKTLGVCAEDIAAGQAGMILCQGVQDGLNLGAYTAGDTLYLGATAGTLTNTKPYAPNHLVYIGVVERANNGNGRLYVRVQNGYELDELHNVAAQNPSNGQTIIYNATTSLWEKNTLTAGTGIGITNGAGSITVSNTGVTSVTGTSPVASSGGATPAISLSSGYGDTQNPYASKTANFILAAPNGTAGVPTFRAVVAADIPTLNQNTTGSAATLTTGRTISITGDLTYTSPSFNGSANVTAAGTLATVNANVGSFTNASITVNGKGLITAASSGTAPVTSVTGTSPVVSSGGTTPAISLASGYGDTQNPYTSKTANFFLAAPNGTAGVPTFRAVVAADIPTLNQNTTGTASNVTGTVAIANGGTGETTRQAAMDALAGAVTSGQYLRGNGTDVVMSAIQAADVPTLNQNTTGSAATLTTARTIQTNLASTSSASFNGSANVTPGVTGTLPIANGGTGQTTQTSAFDALSPATTKGDLIVHNGTNDVRLPVGLDNYVLMADSTQASGIKWAAGGGGGMSDPGANGVVVRTALNTTTARSIAAGTGISVTNGDGVSGNPTIANSGVTSIAGTTSQITASASTGSVTLSLPSSINVDTTGSAGSVTGNATGSTFGFNSGYGSVATAFGCRAWVNFNGTGTIATRGSGNVSSLTDNGVGNYTVNFSNSMPDANYATLTAGNGSTQADPVTTAALIGACSNTTQNTSNCVIKNLYGPGGTAFDTAKICVAIFR
mgnify:CR=1 FL=1|jgi:hypothetical protein